MTPLEASSLTLTTSDQHAGATFAARTVLAAMRRMSAGCLTLNLPDGTTEIMGSRGHPLSASITIRHDAFFQKILRYGDVGFGESYVDGDWDTPSIERVLSWVLLNLETAPGVSGSRVKSGLISSLAVLNRLRHLLRPNTETMARRNIAEHYDLGNDFYKLWLDDSMTYSSALYTRPEMTLREAQDAKYDALCRKLALGKNDHVLEIGCGWGGFASHAVRHYGSRVTAVTISPAQHDFAKERFLKERISANIDLRLQDFRRLEGQYSRIVSIEMMEALGDRFLPTFCQKVDALLGPHGLAAFQYITCPDHRHAALRRGVDWIQKHIFPGSLLLSVARVSEMFAKAGRIGLYSLDDLGPHYARTLNGWSVAFRAAEPHVRALGYGDAFLRKWHYYLQYCEAAFAMKNISVVHAVYTRPNNNSLPV